MRNGTGVFAVINPILIGRLRSSAAVNENYDDGGDEITNTIPINGDVGMSGQFKAAIGTLTLPGISFGSDRNTGLRLRAPDTMAWVAGGQDRLYIDETGKAWFIGAVDIAGAVTLTGALTGGDMGAIEALEGTGLARRTAANTWSLDDGTIELNYIRDGNGTVLPTGVILDTRIPFDCTITAITLGANTTGSCVVDIWKDTYANYPPTNSDSITASSTPTISSSTSYGDSTLTGWTTSIAAGDCLRFNLDSISAITRLVITLTVKRFT